MILNCPQRKEGSKLMRLVICVCINLCVFLSYKHAIDGLIRVYKEEGVKRLFSGATTATSRAVFMTIGQLSFYDQVKMLLLRTGIFGDNMITHFLSSLTAVRNLRKCILFFRYQRQL